MTATPAPSRIGVWLIGARGGLATTLVTGTRMIVRDLVTSAGLLTSTPLFSGLGLPPLAQMVFGGHEIRNGSLFESALQIHRETGTIDYERLQEVREDLDLIDEDIEVGTSFNCGSTVRKLGTTRSRRKPESLAALVAGIRGEMADFRERHDLETVVVVNLASTEPPLPYRDEHRTEAAFSRLIREDRRDTLRASSLYAWAAASLGFPIINFTPSNGALLPAIQKRARRRGAPVMGNDGKTGETLVKSALAPMFKYRNLKVLTWQGYNMLGDRDGQVLSDERNKEAKILSKDSVLSNILGYPLHTHVAIDFVPSLGDLKTAWDFIHFQGFLDYKMSMQFTWQGCDSILAAPLVLDMVRLAAFAQSHGEAGLMTQLACFFKSPVGVDEQDLHFQFNHLLDYADTHQAGRDWPAGLTAEPGQIRVPKGRRRGSS